VLKRLSAAERAAIILEEYAAAIRDAFLAAIFGIRSTVSLRLFIMRIEANDVSGAIEALNIQPAAFNPMLDEIAKAYNAGGNGTINNLPPLRDPQGFRINLLFDARNPLAEAWLRDHSATLVREIVDDQVNSIRVALAAGQARGASALQTALDVVGRVNRATGQRSGGIIGLTSTQAEWVRKYRDELLLLSAGALLRNLRDRRFDNTVRKAIAAGEPLPVEKIDKMVMAYQNRALRYRGEAIAKTESLIALNTGAEEAIRQTVARGAVDSNMIDCAWHTREDESVRGSHQPMNGQVRPYGQSFVSGAGVLLRYPGDPQAPVSEIAGCRCSRRFIIRKRT